MKPYFTVFCFLLMSTLGTSIQANIIHVPADTSTIQGGINMAVDGDTVLVADAKYYENINFKGKKITVASHYLMDGDTSHISNTTISGSAPSHPDSGSVVYFISGEDTNSVLCGFTISGGTGTIAAIHLDRVAAGIIVFQSGAKIFHNKIEGNTINFASVGGVGIGIEMSPSDITLVMDNEISNNTGNSNGGYIFGGGMALRGDGGTCYIKNNNIHHNAISGNNVAGGGILAWLPGTTDEAKLIIENNSICYNEISLLNPPEDVLASGGGIACYTDAKFIVKNNKINFNKVNGPKDLDGGGLSYWSLSISDTNGLIINNEFIGNEVSQVSTILYGGGGGMSISASPIISENIITNNVSNRAGGINLSHIQTNRMAFISKFEQNYAQIKSPVELAIRPVISKNIIRENTCLYSGGGIYLDAVSPLILKNIISDNLAGEGGGGIYCNQLSNPEIINTTIVNNEANDDGGGVYCLNSSPQVINSILYDNNATNNGDQVCLTSGYSDPDFLYCDIEGDSSVFGGNGAGTRYTGLFKNNIDSDPLFSDTLYHLSSSSPCVDTGHPDAIYNDPEDPNNPGYALAPALGTVRNDIGAFGGSIVLEIEKFDIKNIKIPELFILTQNYPNPFNPRTNIKFSMPKSEYVTLKIYNLLGQEVQELVAKRLTPGNYKYTWDASGLASGSYYYRIKAGTFTETKKLLLLK